MQDDKEVFIEFTNSIDIGKQYIDLLGGDDFGVKELHLKIAYDQTQVMHVLFLRQYQLLNDFSPLIHFFVVLFGVSPGPMPPVPLLDHYGGFSL